MSENRKVSIQPDTNGLIGAITKGVIEWERNNYAIAINTIVENEKALVEKDKTIAALQSRIAELEKPKKEGSPKQPVP